MFRNNNASKIEIPEEIWRYSSNAKRHHYVPECLLRRFSTSPEEEHPSIYRLDIKTDTCLKLSTLNCAVVQRYNRLSEASGLPVGYAEAMLSWAEGQAVPVIEKLVHGSIVNQQEREWLSIFIMVQQQRTPRGREWLRFGQEEATKLWLLKQIYENRDMTRKHLRESLHQEPTETEVDASIRELAEPLENGELVINIGSDQEILSMFMPVPTLIPLIYEMNWEFLRAPDGENFILSDEPLVRHDPVNPDGPAAWRSSPTVNVTLPLDPQLCLFLRQTPRRRQRQIDITSDQVLDINLRTYAGARENIFGPTKQLLERVSAVAKANVECVNRYRPNPPAIHLLERTIGKDTPFNVTTIPGPQNIKIRRGSSR